MGPHDRPDPEFEGLLAGRASDDTTELARLVAALRRDVRVPDAEGEHVAAMVEAAAHLHAEDGDPAVRPVSNAVAPVPRVSRLPSRRAILLKVLAPAFALLMLFSGMAFAGVLPAPLQGAVDQWVGNDDDQGTAPVLDDDQGEDLDDQGDATADDDADDQGEDEGNVSDDDQGEDGDHQGEDEGNVSDDDQGEDGDHQGGDGDHQGEDGDDQGDDDQGDDDQGDDDQGDDDQGDDDQGGAVHDQGEDDRGAGGHDGGGDQGDDEQD